MQLIFDDQCLSYNMPGHPESPGRIRTTWEHLRRDHELLSPPLADETDIVTVHSPRLVDAVKSGYFYDADTPRHHGIYDHARRSVGAAILAADEAVAGRSTLSLMRPPGHHAEPDRVMGFCYFNSIAIAAARLLGKGMRVAVIDFDVHHGNGTEAWAEGRDNVMYLSTHQSPLYPGTGLESTANCRNYPMPPGTDDKHYQHNFDQLLDDIDRFEPDILAVSAGFDAYARDPLANFELSVNCFAWIGKCIADIGKPYFSIIEGGYAADLKLCVAAYLRGLEGNT